MHKIKKKVNLYDCILKLDFKGAIKYSVGGKIIAKFWFKFFPFKGY